MLESLDMSQNMQIATFTPNIPFVAELLQSVILFLRIIRETKDTVRVSLQEYLFTGSLKVTSCGFWQKRVRLWDLLEGVLTVLQEPALTVLLVLPKLIRQFITVTVTVL